MKSIRGVKDLINKLFKLDNVYLLLGILVLLLFVWIRFIRERLPRNIPFNLSFWSFIMLSLTCLLYVYLIYRKFKPTTSKEGLLYNTILPFVAHLRKPIILVDNYIKSNSYMLNFIRKILQLCTYILYTPNMYNRPQYIYAHFFILPKVILIICLLVDCFYYTQLNLIYFCVIIITLPLIMRYLLYSIPYFMQHDIALLEKDFLIEITSEDIIYKPEDYDTEGFLKLHLPRYDTEPSHIHYDNEKGLGGWHAIKQYKYLEVGNFIEYQSDAMYFCSLLYTYKILYKEERKDYILLDVGKPIHSNSKVQCEELLWFNIRIRTLKEHINSTTKYFHDTLKKIDITINILFLVCWIYILLKSIHTLPENSFEWLKYFVAKYDSPFI